MFKPENIDCLNGYKRIEVTTDPTESQRLVRDYYKQLHANEMGTLEDMDKFLERYKLPGLNK